LIGGVVDGEGADEKQPVSRKAVERTNAVVSEGDPVLSALAYPTG
jgi:hypothetical protein